MVIDVLISTLTSIGHCGSKHWLNFGGDWEPTERKAKNMFSNSIKQTNEKIVARDVIINKLSFVSVKADINWERGIS